MREVDEGARSMRVMTRVMTTVIVMIINKGGETFRLSLRKSTMTVIVERKTKSMTTPCFHQMSARFLFELAPVEQNRTY